MAEAMSEARLAEIREDHAKDLRDIETFGLGALVRGDRTRTGVTGALLAEIDRLRAQLAEIGETREEWTIERRWRDGMVTQTKTWTDEATARANLAYEPADDFHRDVQVSAKPHLMRRVAGEWREVEQ